MARLVTSVTSNGLEGTEMRLLSSFLSLVLSTLGMNNPSTAAAAFVAGVVVADVSCRRATA